MLMHCRASHELPQHSVISSWASLIDLLPRPLVLCGTTSKCCHCQSNSIHVFLDDAPPEWYQTYSRNAVNIPGCFIEIYSLCHVLKDLQMVNISLRVLSRPDARMLPTMYRQLGVDYDERVLPSICNEVSYFVSRCR